MRETGPFWYHYIVWGWLGLLLAIMGPPPGRRSYHWHIAGRCQSCGARSSKVIVLPGQATPQDLETHRNRQKTAERLLCDACGASWDQVYAWVGRESWWGPEWKPVDQLPDDLISWLPSAIKPVRVAAAPETVPPRTVVETNRKESP